MRPSKFAGTIDRVLAEMWRTGMRGHAVHAHDGTQTAFMSRKRRIRGRLADDRGIDLRAPGGIELGAFAGDFFIGDENTQQRARPCGAIGCEHAHGLQHRGQRPLAVAGAAAVKLSARLLQENGSDDQPSPTGTTSMWVLKRENRAGAVLHPRNHVDASRLVFLERGVESFRRQKIAHICAASASFPGGFCVSIATRAASSRFMRATSGEMAIWRVPECFNGGSGRGSAVRAR